MEFHKPVITKAGKVTVVYFVTAIKKKLQGDFENGPLINPIKVTV